MSTSDLEHLEATRDELRDVVMTMISIGLTYETAREELMPAIFKVGSAIETIEWAIEAHGELAADERSEDG